MMLACDPPTGGQPECPGVPFIQPSVHDQIVAAVTFPWHGGWPAIFFWLIVIVAIVWAVMQHKRKTPR